MEGLPRLVKCLVRIIGIGIHFSLSLKVTFNIVLPSDSEISDFIKYNIFIIVFVFSPLVCFSLIFNRAS